MHRLGFEEDTVEEHCDPKRKRQCKGKSILSHLAK
jgi:alanine racemase